MSRFIRPLLIAILLIAPLPALVYADCETPQPTATPEPTYAGNVLATQSGHLIAYWRLNETAGTTAADSSGNGRDGTYNGVTLNATTFPNGDPAPSFDGVNDYVDVYSSSLASAFNGSEGTALFWLKGDSTYWTDNARRFILTLSVDATNAIEFEKQTNNTIQLRYRAGGVALGHVKTTTTTNWTVFVLTWSHSGDHTEAYQDGTTYQNRSGLGTFSGSLSSTRSSIGRFDAASGLYHLTSLSNVALWDVALSDSEVTALATVPTAGATQTPQPTCTPSPTATYTPTGAPTATMTFTPSLTADIHQFWTLPPPETTGTPEPGQPVAFVWKVEAGDVAVALVLGAISFSLWAMFVIWILRRRKRG